MAKLNQVRSVVLRVLAEHEDARKNDFILISRVLDEMGVPSNFDMRTMLHNHTTFGLPSFASVFRARRKIQAEYPEFKDAKTVEIRAAEQEEYKEFARQ